MGDLVFVLLVVSGLGAVFFTKWHKEDGSCAEPGCAVTTVAEEAAAEEAVAEEVVAEEVVAEEVVAEEVVAEEKGELDALSWRILQKVLENPGLLQTMLYKKFPREKRKTLQAVLLQLDNEKVLHREKEGNSYRLYPI